MQVFTSQYGRKGCRVSDAVPTRSIRRYLGTVHVGVSDAGIEAAIREQIRKVRDGNAFGEADRWTDLLAEQTVRYAVWQHGENRAEYTFVMNGAGV
jgi:hypothetical protein